MREGKFGMRSAECGVRGALVALIYSSFALCFSSLVFAQDEPPPKALPGMRITFLPPPMEGTLSLGIYDKKGKLVRVMAREATEKDFTIGLNGLITYWDGKDDSGKVMPTGIYYARGYSVGAVDVEGVALHGNDWITDEAAPRPVRVLELKAKADDKVDVVLRTASGTEVTQSLDFHTQPAEPPQTGARVSVADGKVKLETNGETRDFPLTDGGVPIDAALGSHC